MHTYIENECMYPQTRELMPDLEDDIHHMGEEEDDWFLKVRAGLGRKRLQEMGAHMVEMKKNAPRKPSQPSALKKALDALIA